MARRRYDRALLVTNTAPGHPNADMLTGLGEGLEAIGIAAEVVLVRPDGGDIGRFVEQALAADPARTILVDVNGRMRLKEARGLRKVSFLTDHPYALVEQIADAPADAVLGCVDRSHLPFLEAMGDRHQGLFLPHGGPTPAPDPPPMERRDIELLFAGRLETSPRLSDLVQGLASNPEPVRRIVAETAEAAADGSVLFDAFAEACRRRSLDPADFDSAGIAAALHAASAFAEAYNRHKVLTGLGSLAVHIVGTVADGFFAPVPENLRFHGPRPFAEVRALMGRARIVLNSVTVFPDGSHERVWYGMAAGAAVLTDRGAFVAADFADRHSILFWPKPAAAVADLLGDTGRLQAIADAARPIYAARHTWRSRARLLDLALNG